MNAERPTCAWEAMRRCAVELPAGDGVLAGRRGDHASTRHASVELFDLSPNNSTLARTPGAYAPPRPTRSRGDRSTRLRSVAFAGETIELKGRTAPGTPTLTIERDAGGGAWQPAGTATPAPNGTFTATVAAATGFRARTAAGKSPAVTATVQAAPKVKLTASKGRLKVTTTPAAKGLVARFEERRASGWRRFASAKLDSAGRASVKGREGKLRVVLARGTGKAALATSKTVRL